MDVRRTQVRRADVAVADITPTRPRTLLVVLLMAAAVAAAMWFYTRGAAVTTARVSRGTAAEIVYATGAVEPDRWARVATLVTGRIVERCRCEGESVEKGALLARLDDSEAQAALREFRAREEFARKELERQKELEARRVATTQALQRAVSELEQVQGLIAVQSERLANYQLVAPIDGIVLREEGEIGEIVSSNTILYRIGWPKPLLVVAEVNEEDIPRVQVGQVVLLRSDAFSGRRLTGTVRDITPAGDPVARTYRIRVALPDDTPLLVGMTIEANVISREKKNVLLIPAAAVSGNSAYVIEGSRAVRRPVEIGIRGTQMVEVLSGLEEGERVVSPVPSDLRDGTRIRLTGDAPAAKS